MKEEASCLGLFHRSTQVNDLLHPCDSTSHVLLLGQEEAEAGRKSPERFLEDLASRLLRKGGAGYERSWGIQRAAGAKVLGRE